MRNEANKAPTLPFSDLSGCEDDCPHLIPAEKAGVERESKKRAVFNVQCLVQCVKCAVFSMQSVVCSVLCAVCGV